MLLLECDDGRHPLGLWRLARFRFHLRLIEPVILPPYRGRCSGACSARRCGDWCVLPPRRMCGECAFAAKCLYTAIFEPVPPPGAREARKYLKAPRPFVLNPPLTNRQSFHPGETLAFDLVLIGPAIEALPYFIYIFQEVGKKGLGRERSRYELIRVDSIQNSQPVTIYENDTIFANRLAVEAGPVSHPEDQSVTFSQKETMKLGGLKGSVSFSGERGPFLPYMRLGEQVNVGQGTTFGLGRYVCSPERFF